MKNPVLKTFLLLITSTFTLTSCELFDSVGDVSFNEPISATLTVDEDDAGTDMVYSREASIDASANPEIKKYESKIKSISINKITFKISNYSGEEAITPLSTISYSSKGGSSNTAVEISSITNFNLHEAATSGTETELTVSNAELEKIATILKEDMAVKFYLNGSLSKTPVKFDVDFTVDATIKASALD